MTSYREMVQANIDRAAYMATPEYRLKKIQEGYDNMVSQVSRVAIYEIEAAVRSSHAFQFCVFFQTVGSGFALDEFPVGKNAYLFGDEVLERVQAHYRDHGLTVTWNPENSNRNSLKVVIE